MRLGKQAGGAVALGLALLVAVGVPAAGAATDTPLQRETFGRSVQHRPLKLTRVGDPAAPHVVLVVGCIHGSERAGMAVTRALRGATPPQGTQLLLVDTVNPDGSRRGRRGNARGVDLNRNFPWGWRPLDGLYASGPRASSEPETRAIEQLVVRERPDVSIWFHQHLNWVDLQRGSSVTLMRRYARVAGMRAVRTPLLPGTVARWENHRLPAATSFVVELPAGSLAAGRAAVHARAVLAVARP